jgi:folate-binding protein YgfZ
MCLSHPKQRYLVMQPAHSEHSLNSVTTDAQQYWEIDDIRSGLADVREATSNEYVPQMLNLQVLNAIDFEKGCYMGQEVVARTKYLGRNKRAGFILYTDRPLDDLTGQQLEYQIGENWRPGGKVLRSGADHQQTWIFAVLANDTINGSVFRLKSQNQIVFTVQEQPYNISE